MDEYAECNFCLRLRTDEDRLYTVQCNIRKYLHKYFHLWRCANCHTIHCNEIIDFDVYYKDYPFATAVVNDTLNRTYKNQFSRLKMLGVQKSDHILDYGCGSGNFLHYLFSAGYVNSVGYDPYSERYFDNQVLAPLKFDFIILQDVLEHVINPRELLLFLNDFLAEGGYCLIGTPNASNIDLNRASFFKNELHPPFHLHIYTKEVVMSFASIVEWEMVEYFDRQYTELPWPGFNVMTMKLAQSFYDGSIDVFFEGLKSHGFRIGFLSPKFIFYFFFGHWFSPKADMALVFKKPIQ